MKLPGKVGADAEKRIAKLVGGRVRPASGARWFARGDVATSTTLIQSKTTKVAKRQYTLKLADFLAIERQALAEDRDPMMLVEFDTPNGRHHLKIERYYGA